MLKVCLSNCRNAKTFPRLAEALGFVGKDDIFHVIKAIVATQRDYGRRDDRKQSRLKYLIEDWGIDKFRLVVEQYYGKKIEPFRFATAIRIQYPKAVSPAKMKILTADRCFLDAP